MSTTALQKRTADGALEMTVIRAHGFNAKLFLPKLANGRLRFDSNGELVADDSPENFIVKTTTYTAKSGDRIAADTTSAAFTITLPLAPGAGDRIQIMDAAGQFATHNITVGRNGQPINSSASNITLSATNAIAELVYINSTIGWKVIYQSGASGNLAITGTLSVTSDVAVNTNKFNVTASNGNTAVAGTLAVTGAVTMTAAATVGTTLGVTGLTTLTGGLVGGIQSLSGAGAVNVSTLTTGLTTTGGAQALTLADGTNGQIKTIIHDVDGGSAVLTPTTKTGFSTITFTAVGDAAVLQFLTTRGWYILSLRNAVAA